MFLSFFFFPPLYREQYTYSCGRESMILGVHPFALKANISDRVAQLAMPKPEPEGHTEQRSVCYPLLFCACCRQCLLYTAPWNHRSRQNTAVIFISAFTEVIKKL